MTPKLRLNLTESNEAATVSAQARIKAAGERKKAATEIPSLEESWQKIFASKLDDTQREKLIEVKNAMDSGLIGRRSEECVNKNGKPKAFSKAEAERLWKVLQESQREQKLADMVTNTPTNYELITTERQFESLLAELALEPIVAVDTETTGVDVYTDVIVGMSFSLPKADKHVYIPIDHKGCEQLSRDYVLDGLKPILYDESIGKVLHNAN